MIKQKNQPLALLVIFALSMTPLTLGFVSFYTHPYPAGPFGGGGDAKMSGYVCGPMCDGIVAWLIDRGLNYVADHWSDPSGCATGTCVGNASMGGVGSAGSLGGGGGNTF